MALRRIVLISLSSLCLLGCVRKSPPAFRQDPSRTVMFFLKNINRPGMRRELYTTLSHNAQRQTPYKDFIRRLRREMPPTSTGEHTSDMRIIITVIESIFLSNKRAVIYAVATFYHPYRSGKSDQYRVIRLHCSREKRGMGSRTITRRENIHPEIPPRHLSRSRVAA